MKVLLNWGAMFVWIIGSTFARAQADTQPSARNRVMRLEQSGTGLWMQANRADAKIVRVTIGGNPAGRLGVNFSLSGPGKREFGAHMAWKGANSMELKIADGGSANASGTLFVAQRMSAVAGRGILDGQPFAAQFVAGVPLRIDQNSGGWGEWTSADGDPIGVYRAGYIEDSQSNVELLFFLGDGTVGWLEGRASPVKGERAVRVQVTKSVSSNASGEFEVMLGRSGQIVSISGNGEVDGKSVRASFVASDRPLPAKVEIIDSSLSQLKLVRGTWTEGDASSKYAAYVNDAWIQRIDVEMREREYGSGVRHLYFSKDKLMFYSESAMRRKANPASPGAMDEVTLQLAFDSHGNLSSSFKTVNGKVARLTEPETRGADTYAEALRQAAEEVASEAAKPD